MRSKQYKNKQTKLAPKKIFVENCFVIVINPLSPFLFQYSAAELKSITPPPPYEEVSHQLPSYQDVVDREIHVHQLSYAQNDIGSYKCAAISFALTLQTFQLTG